MTQRLAQNRNQEQCIWEKEDYEVFMITVAKTVVDEGAVVVMKLNTPAALVTVEWSFSFDYFTVWAEWFESYSRVDCFVNKLHEVELFLDVAGIESDWNHERRYNQN